MDNISCHSNCLSELDARNTGLPNYAPNEFLCGSQTDNNEMPKLLNLLLRVTQKAAWESVNNPNKPENKNVKVTYY